MSFLQQKQLFRVTFSLVPRLWLLWVFEAMHLLTVPLTSLVAILEAGWEDMSKNQLSMFPVPTNQCHFVLCRLTFWRLHGTCNKILWWFAMYSLSGWYRFLKTFLFSCLEVQYYKWTEQEKCLNNNNNFNSATKQSGQNIIFHQPGFSFSIRDFPYFSPPFGGFFGRVRSL